MCNYARVRDCLELLDSVSAYVVTKSHAVEATLARGGDLDLLVEDIEKAHRLLIDYFGQPAREVNSLYSIALYFDWGEIDLVKGIHWRGISLAETDDVLADRVRMSDGIFVTRPAHEMLFACLYPKISYGGHKPGYQAILDRAIWEDSAATWFLLNQSLGTRCANEIFSKGSINLIPTATLRRALVRRALSNQSSIPHMLGFLRTRTRQKLDVLLHRRKVRGGPRRQWRMSSLVVFWRYRHAIHDPCGGIERSVPFETKTQEQL